MEISEAAFIGQKICGNVSKVIAGKNETVKLAVTALYAGGHLLLDDVPGTGKTTLAKSLAKSVGADFKRIQFTPDLLPSDLTGINFFNQKLSDFTFRKGPVFTNILLADEINRATPRTQSSLLECMEESQVTVDGTTYQLDEPYFVIATQNPVETQGTFPLPEAQLDRFLIKTDIGYPSPENSVLILARFRNGDPLAQLLPVCTAEQLIEAKTAVRSVFLHPDLERYIVDMVEKTRVYEGVALGVSPRGSLAMLRAAQAKAALDGRGYVTPEDVKFLAPFVFAHRIILRDDYAIGRTKPEDIIANICGDLPVPSEKWDNL